VVLKLENSWFMKTKYILQSKHQEILNKYCEKITKVVSEKKFDEEIIINHLLKLLKNNKTKLINDLENVKKKKNYVIKIQDSFKGCNLSLCINIKKTKKDEMKLCVRIKENGFAEVYEFKENVIAFIKRAISFDIFKELI